MNKIIIHLDIVFMIVLLVMKTEGMESQISRPKATKCPTSPAKFVRYAMHHQRSNNKNLNKPVFLLFNKNGKVEFKVKCCKCAWTIQGKGTIVDKGYKNHLQKKHKQNQDNNWKDFWNRKKTILNK